MRLEDAPDVLNVEEVQDLLRISRGKVYEAIRTGEIPRLPFGRPVRVSKAAIARMLDPDGQNGHRNGEAPASTPGLREDGQGDARGTEA